MEFRRYFSLLLTVCLIFSGCSVFRDSTEQITVTVDQRDAEIYINGSLVGRGTASMAVKRNQNVAVMAKKAGYYPSTRTIGKSLSATGILDIIGGAIWLVPFFGLLAPGAYALDESNVNLILVKEE